MQISSPVWRNSKGSAVSSILSMHRPESHLPLRALLVLALGLMLFLSFTSPLTVSAQNLGTSPQFGKAVQGQQATTVEGTVLNIVNWGCNVIAPVLAVACLGVAGWHFKSGRGYMGWGVTGVALMVISGLGRMAEGFITQSQGIQ